MKIPHVLMAVSLFALVILFIAAYERMHQPTQTGPFAELQTTAVPRWQRTTIAGFAIMNLPSAVVFVILEVFLPNDITPILRESIAFASAAVVCVLWWYLLGRAIERRRHGS